MDNAIKIKIMEAAYSGEKVDLSSKDDKEVDADFIRKLMKGLHGGNQEHTRARMYGVHLKGATIKGALDISDTDNMAGLTPPYLLLEECIIGDTIKLNHAHLKRLSLRGSTIVHLEATGARIDGEVDLSHITVDLCGNKKPSPTVGEGLIFKHAHMGNIMLTGGKITHFNANRAHIRGTVDISGIESSGSCKGAKGKDMCWLEFRGATIDGRIVAKKAKLCAPAKRDDHDQHTEATRYALDLGSTIVRGNILLQPGFVAYGGVNLIGARVKGMIWMSGAHLVAEEGSALRGQHIHLEESFVLRGLDKDCENSVPPKVQGKIDFYAAQITGTFQLDGLNGELDKDEEDYKASINLSNSTIGIDLLMNAHNWESKGQDRSFQFKAESIYLDGATIGSSVWLSGAEIKVLNLINATIANDMHISKFKAESINLDGATIGGSLKLDGAEINELKSPNATIANDMHISKFKAESINLDGATIGGSLKLHGAEITTQIYLSVVTIGHNFEIYSGNIENISLRDAKIGTSLLVTGSCKLSNLNANGAKIGGNVVFNPILKQMANFTGARIEGICQLGSYLMESLEWTYKAKLDFEHAEISGALKVHIADEGKIEEDNSSQSESLTKYLEDILSSKTKYTGEKIALDFYPGWNLVELNTGTQTKPKIIAFLWDGDKESILLDGTSPPIHKLNARGGLKIDDTEKADKYLRFFCSYVWGDDGAFRIIESKKELPNLKDDLKKYIKPLEIYKDGEDYIATAIINYGEFLFESDFKIFNYGMVEMIDDNPLGGTPIYVIYDPPFKSLAKDGGLTSIPNHFKGVGNAIGLKNSEFEKAIACFIDTAKRSLKTIEDTTVESNRLPIILRGLNVGILDDDHGKGWGEHVKLELDGFTYNSILEKSNTTNDKDDLWNERLKWLRRQYDDEDNPTSIEYIAQPYHQAAEALRTADRHEAADKIRKEAWDIERRHEPDRVIKILSFLWKWFFGYGLSFKNTIATFVVLILVGWIVINYANKIGMLVIDMEPTASVAVEQIGLGSQTVRLRPGTPMQDEQNAETLLPCGDAISPPLYALDIFIPLLDIRQEFRCHIRPYDEDWNFNKAGKIVNEQNNFIQYMKLWMISFLTLIWFNSDYWLWGKALYTVIGWAVISIAILTASIKLRRNLEG